MVNNGVGPVYGYRSPSKLSYGVVNASGAANRKRYACSRLYSRRRIELKRAFVLAKKKKPSRAIRPRIETPDAAQREVPPRPSASTAPCSPSIYRLTLTF